jgi:hypothetical protein
MDSSAKDPTRRALNFDEEQDDGSATTTQQSTKQRQDTDHRFDAFRTKSTHQNHSMGDQTSAYAAADSTKTTVSNMHTAGVPHSNVVSPKPTIQNPYSSGRTPLSDKELCQANDFYLGGRYGKDDADELEALYEVLNLPTNCFQNVLYTFIRVIEEEDVPYLSDKEIKNLPRLSSLEPEAFVDWYDDMESELLMITSVSLLPFDAIVINWQYVGLCIPGIGERRYLEMARVLWRVCEKTLPRDEEAVRNAFKANSNRGRDGFRLLWDVLIRSQPAFNPIKSFPKPTWHASRDIGTLAKRWILYFRFMGKTPEVGFLSDTEQSTHFLKSIQEPALLSQAQSLLVTIINENQMQPVKMRGRAALPTHLKINALSETLAQTIQPIDNELGFAPAAHHTQYQLPYGASMSMFPQSPSYGAIGQSYIPPFCSPIGHRLSPLPQFGPAANAHVMQGYGDPPNAASNQTERKKGGSRKETGPRSNAKPTEKPVKPKVTCQACFMQGHEAINCWALARALLTQHFIRNLVDKSVLDKVKENYKLRFHPPENARANKLCSDTLWSYCVDNKVTAEQVCEEMNWKGFADSRNDTDVDSDDDDDSSDEERESTERM